MGCDIHTRFEVRGPDGRWESLLNPSPNKEDICHHEARIFDAKEEGRPEPKMYLEYCGRNYALFEILGLGSGNSFTPIAPLRGIPDDVSEGFRELVAQYSGDDHSHTWVTIEEIIDPTWHSRRLFCEGTVSPSATIRRTSEWSRSLITENEQPPSSLPRIPPKRNPERRGESRRTARPGRPVVPRPQPRRP